MQSMIIIPISQTGKDVISTTIDISKSSEFHPIMYSDTFIEDRTAILIPEVFINTPLYMRVTKAFSDDTYEEFADINPITRGKTKLVREEEFLTEIIPTVKRIDSNGKTTLTVRLDRPVDYVHITALRGDTSEVVMTYENSGDTTIMFELDNYDFLDTNADIVIVTQLNEVRYRTIDLLTVIPNSAKLVGLKHIYYTNTYTNIEVATKGSYRLYVNDKLLPHAVTNMYNIREYIQYGNTVHIKLSLNDGTTIEKVVETSSEARGYNPYKVINDVVADSEFTIDRLLIPNPPNGTILNDTIFYVVKEDNRENLYSYYIPGDTSRKLDPSFNTDSRINEIIVIDDGLIALVVTGSTDKITLYNYYKNPLSITDPLNLNLTDFANCKLAYLPVGRAFFYIETDKLVKIDLLHNITNIPTPVSFTDGYISRMVVTELAVILDNVMYSYDMVTGDWDTLIALPTDLSSRVYKYLTPIPEGVLLVCEDGVVYKFDKATSDFYKYESDLGTVSSVLIKDNGIMFTNVNDTALREFK